MFNNRTGLNIITEHGKFRFLAHTFCFLLTVFTSVFATPIAHSNVINSGSNDPASPASCFTTPAGAPSCGISNTPGSIPANPDIPLHVGNPINVVSGNKYQYELDYQSIASGLAFARHYNSVLTPYDTGLGPGWRHTFQVTLVRANERQMHIVQSDGRLITFTKSQKNETQSLFESESAVDGYIVTGNRSIWHMPDGRRLIFQGSFLVAIEFANQRGKLYLQYQNGKLLTVTDNRGEVLTFHYTSDTPSLPIYGSNDNLQPAGSIESITTASGSVTKFRYDTHRNLVSVLYPDTHDITYGYQNPQWPSHLTERRSSHGDRHSKWQYDDNGHAISWREGDGINGLNITRTRPYDEEQSTQENSSDSNGSAAIVTYVDGRSSHYQWSDGYNGNTGEIAAMNVTCDNCKPESDLISTTLYNEPAKPVSADTTSNSNIDNRAQGLIRVKNPDVYITDSPLITSTYALLESLQIVKNQNTTTPSSYTTYAGIYPHEKGNIPLEVTTDRNGKVKDLTIGTLKLKDIVVPALRGELPECTESPSLEDAKTFSHDRIYALGTDSQPCSLDAMAVMELNYYLENLGSWEPTDTNESLPPDNLRGRAKQLNWWDEMYRYCGLPAGKTCAELAENLKMAQLSRCAYGTISCEPAFELIDPTSLNNPNLLPNRFSDNGFDTQLYRDPSTKNYILVFRGTDDAGDWEDNFAQALGHRARQYDLAVNLATDLVAALPGQNVSFAGHSLGGGLATIAALKTQKSATVFNAAAVQSNTADLYSLQTQYQNANTYINHIHTDYDPVTGLQNAGDFVTGGRFQSAPGRTTEIPNPDHPWMNAKVEKATKFSEAIPPLIWHSMEAVVHVLESLFHYNCTV